MVLDQNKRGFQAAGWGIVIGAALLFLAGGLIIGIIKFMSSEVEEGQQERLCRVFNEMRFAAKEENPLNFPVGPDVCRTIDKGEIPSDDYEQTTDGAKQEIRDLMARCWWMWLEGTQIDMFGKGTLSKQPCFACYTFSIKKSTGIESFPVSALDKSLIQAFDADDTSDKCVSTGGGFCEYKKCVNPLYPKEVPSNKCKTDEVCCVAEEPQDECINRGGNCLPECDKDYPFQYNKWSCAKRRMSCCIKSDNYVSYLDYFQADANGKILFQEDLEFKPQEDMYAISFLSPGRECGIENIKCWMGFFASIAAGLGTSVFLSPIGGVAVGGAGMSLSLIKLGEITDINYLLVSEFKGLEDKCAAQFGED